MRREAPRPGYPARMEVSVGFEALLAAARANLVRLVVPDPEPIAMLFLDVPGAGPADAADAPQTSTLASFGGVLRASAGSAVFAWFEDPAAPIAAWLAVGEEFPGALGGVAMGLARSHDLLAEVTEEVAGLATLAAPGELMVTYELATAVDLRDPRLTVEKTDQGSLVPWSCRLRRRSAAPATTRDLQEHDVPACDAIVAGLPEWFGNAQGIEDCAAAVRSQSGLVGLDDAGEVVSFLTWEVPAYGVAEITWMAVRADSRRRGHGRTLLEALVERLRTARVRELHVKTLSSRGDPYPPYEETRAFYRANGFEEVQELDIWGPENPALLLARQL